MKDFLKNLQEKVKNSSNMNAFRNKIESVDRKQLYDQSKEKLKEWDDFFRKEKSELNKKDYSGNNLNTSSYFYYSFRNISFGSFGSFFSRERTYFIYKRMKDRFKSFYYAFRKDKKSISEEDLKNERSEFYNSYQQKKNNENMPNTNNSKGTTLSNYNNYANQNGYVNSQFSNKTNMNEQNKGYLSSFKDRMVGTNKPYTDYQNQSIFSRIRKFRSNLFWKSLFVSSVIVFIYSYTKHYTMGRAYERQFAQFLEMQKHMNKLSQENENKNNK